MTMFIRVLTGCLALSLTAGCLSPAKIERALSAVNRVSDYESLDSRIDVLPQTAVADLPTQGSADFDGMGNLQIRPSNGSSTLQILGDVNMTADFGDGTLTGNMTEMRGASGTRLTNTKFFDAVGEITFGGRTSSIGDLSGNGAAGFETDFRGSFDTDVRGQWTVDGMLVGAFVGDNGPSGLVGSSRDANAVRNVSDNAMSLDILAER